MAWSRSDDKRLEQALLALGRGERRDDGEPVGLAELYELMGRAIFTTAYVITGHREDAEDILQDTLVEIYQDARFYRPRTNPRAWVLTVTRHTALDADAPPGFLDLDDRDLPGDDPGCLICLY